MVWYGPIVGLKLSLTRQAASLKRPTGSRLRHLRQSQAVCQAASLSSQPLDDGGDEGCRSMSLQDGANGIVWPFAMAA